MPRRNLHPHNSRDIARPMCGKGGLRPYSCSGSPRRRRNYEQSPLSRRIRNVGTGSAPSNLANCQWIQGVSELSRIDATRDDLNRVFEAWRVRGRWPEDFHNREYFRWARDFPHPEFNETNFDQTFDRRLRSPRNRARSPRQPFRAH
jgi:hypothetical protein